MPSTTEEIIARRQSLTDDPTTVKLSVWVDELCVQLAREGTEQLKALGFEGQVVVNIEWTDNPEQGWLCVGSRVERPVTDLLQSSLQQSATEVEKLLE